MAMVNRIPTSQEFKKRIGRTGVSSAFKMKDKILDTILRDLHKAEVWRNKEYDTAIQALRKVRKACCAWIVAADKRGKTRASRPHINRLLSRIHDRINVVVESLYAHKVRTARENWNFLLSMHNLTDEDGKKLPHRDIGRKLSPGYVLERATAIHFVGHNIKPIMKKIWELETNRNQTKLDLNEWLTHIWIPQHEDDPTGVFIKYITQAGGNWVINTDFVSDLKSQRVKYCNAEERKEWQLTISLGHVLNKSGELYHTGKKETHFSGRGWAIYVIDYEDNWYSNTHKVGHFHHSSFMSGNPVQAAGEIAVNNGKVIAITNKTGHYKAGQSELAQALLLLKHGGVTLTGIKVSDPFRQRGRWADGQKVLDAGGDVKKAIRNRGTVSSPTKVPPVPAI